MKIFQLHWCTLAVVVLLSVALSRAASSDEAAELTLRGQALTAGAIVNGTSLPRDARDSGESFSMPEPKPQSSWRSLMKQVNEFNKPSTVATTRKLGESVLSLGDPDADRQEAFQLSSELFLMGISTSDHLILAADHLEAAGRAEEAAKLRQAALEEPFKKSELTGNLANRLEYFGTESSTPATDADADEPETTEDDAIELAQ